MDMKRAIGLFLLVFVCGLFVPDDALAQKRRKPSRYSYKKGKRRSSRGGSRGASSRRKKSYSRSKRGGGKSKSYARYRGSSRASGGFSGANSRTFATLSANLNAMNYFGDLSPTDAKFAATDFSFTKPGLGIQYAYQFSQYVGARVAYNYGRIKGDDANQPNDGSGRLERNLNFRNDIHELSLGLEVNFFPIQSAGRRPAINPFIFLGVAAFYHNPEGFFPKEMTYAEGNTVKFDAVDFPEAGSWIPLRPLGTEGQNAENSGVEPYKPLNLAIIPLGFGVKFILPGQLEMAAEFGPRLLFTDYLDDVSDKYPDPSVFGSDNEGRVARFMSLGKNLNGPQDDQGIRGGSNFNDFYFISQIRISYILPGGGSRAKFR